MMDRRSFLTSVAVFGIGTPSAFVAPQTAWAQVSREQLGVTASQYLFRYGNCAQASFATLQEHLSLEGGKIFKALAPFPGIGLRGETCGAVIGSIMALGLIFGRDTQDDYSKFLSSASIAREFCEQFKEEQGSTMCGDIVESHLGKRYNLADPVEAEAFQAVVGGLCIRVVTSAVRIASDLVKRHRPTA